MKSTDEGRRPGRPSNETGPVITRAELLDTAQRMIAEKGFDGTSIRGLAREAGVTHGTVQHHFPTKQALWRAVVDEVIVPGIEVALSRLSDDASGGVEAVIATRLRQALTTQGLSGAVLLDNTDGGLERLTYLADATQTSRADGNTQIQSLAAAGALRPVNPTAISALDIALFCLGSATDALRTFLDIDISDDQQREALVAGITDIYLYGVIPRT